jgi:cytosine/uracil/thiamine/allantoin permease
MPSARSVIHKLRIPEEQESTPWVNEDLKPVPLERQSWGMLIPQVLNRPTNDL